MVVTPENPLEKVTLRKLPSLEQIVDTIVDGHAQKKHLCQFASLRITTRLRLKEHLMEILPSPHTECFSNWHHEPKSPADFFYHAKSNTFTVFPYKTGDEPTTYLPTTGRVKFDHKYTKAILCAQESGLALPAPKIYGGINSLHAELCIKEVILLNNVFKK